MKKKFLIRYVWFYVGLALIAMSLFFLKNETSKILAIALCTFFALRITSLPMTFLFSKIINKPKHSVFGIDNEKFFSWSTILSGSITIFFIFFKASPEMIFLLMVVTIICLDTAFCSKWKNDEGN